MKKNLFVCALFALVMAFTADAYAQKATSDDYKNLKKQEKLMDKELQKKAIKSARKEAKALEKEGFKTPVGKLPLAKQIENAWEKQAELDMEGNPYWYTASARVIGGNQSAAALQATNMAKIDLAGQIRTKVSQLIEAKVYGTIIKIWLLSQCAWTKVLSPIDLVDKIKEDIRVLNALYSN